MVLLFVWKRELEMDGKVPGLWGMEYNGRGDSGDREEIICPVCLRTRCVTETDASFRDRLNS